MLTFKMTASLYVGNISATILSNNKKQDTFKIYAKRALEKYPR